MNFSTCVKKFLALGISIAFCICLTVVIAVGTACAQSPTPTPKPAKSTTTKKPTRAKKSVNPTTVDADPVKNPDPTLKRKPIIENVPETPPMKPTAKTTVKTPSKRTAVTHNYVKGKDGGCYYINSKGRKEYVSRDKCKQ